MMKEEENKQEIETQIEAALHSRIQHFKENADSLTLERVRRLIEKDLGLEKCALDVHKRFIKNFLEKQMENADDESATKGSEEILEKDTSSTQQEQVSESPKKQVIKKDVKEPALDDEGKMDDSPIMGVMSSKSESADAQGVKPSESTIKKAVLKRAAHIRTNSESITLAGVRRLLEEDLGHEKYTLDPFKKFIQRQIDELLASSEAPKSTSSSKKKPEKRSKTAKKTSSGDNSDSFSDQSENVTEKVKSRKKSAAKEKVEKSEGLKKRKRPNSGDVVLTKKQNKVSKSDENSDVDTNKSESEDDRSESSAENPVKKKVVKAASASNGYGKRVEHLRSIFKACGMSVAPSVYKRAKQVSDDKREGFLIKELEKILSAEGLSNNPTEKEIKEVRKRKQTAKELEGIDLSNIVSSSRRRSTTSFVAPPRPKSPVKAAKKDEKISDSNNDDVSDDGDDDNEDEDEDEDEDGSQSEEFDEDDNEDSD